MHLCILDGSYLLPSEYDQKGFQKFTFMILFWREFKTILLRVRLEECWKLLMWEGYGNWWL